MRAALFPGSFDPLHNGHLEIVEMAARTFDRVVVAPLHNSRKGVPLFTLQERAGMIADAVAHLDNVGVAAGEGLAVDLAREVGADVIVKGLRVASDFEHELQMAQMNEALAGVVTLFLPCASTSSFISSSLIRDIVRLGGAGRVASMVPPPVAKRLAEVAL
ncbi:MAG TPA: pantetheine-phosphate adenylyltransferase [Acidimicrobiales bacterium]|nr:pantetheine-phosphate adenylyltransferase [Acidimicrobiales bacterium]